MKALNIIFAIVFILTCAEASAHGDNGESSGQEEYARQDEAAEDIFAGYFDIRTGCGEGEEVTGRIHLERNKDILHSPVPKGWHFEITGQPAENLFSIRTWRDLSGRVMGIFSVAEGKHTGSVERTYPMEMALMDGEDVLGRFSVEIHIEEQTLWETLYERYVPIALETGRMYGRMRFSDSRTAELIGELEETGGRFRGLRCYDAKPQDYVGDFGHDDEFLPTGTIEYDWEKVVNMIGGLGYSYAKSAIYGPEGDPEKRERLRDALYHAILTYASSVPVEGTDMIRPDTLHADILFRDKKQKIHRRPGRKVGRNTRHPSLAWSMGRRQSRTQIQDASRTAAHLGRLQKACDLCTILVQFVL